MSESEPNKPSKKNDHGGFIHHLDKSAIFTVIGIILLFSCAVIVTLLAPRYVDPTWTSPSSAYQVQMYEVSDPNVYISSASTGSSSLQYVYHLKNQYTLLLFRESDFLRIVAPPELSLFVTKNDESTMKLTSRLLLLRQPQKSESFDALAQVDTIRSSSEAEWEKNNPDWKEKKLSKPTIEVLELYDPKSEEAFTFASSGSSTENWVDSDYKIVDASPQHPYHQGAGVIYVYNPQEFRVTRKVFNEAESWAYDPKGEPLKDLQHLKEHPLGFHSRADLIAMGEHIYAIEGCWYCHTDQTRTLVQDVVLNGSDSYPAPPSTANEYIYQKITFPGTRRIGPDISRVGIKRPSRDWHKGHFWSPKTASHGSIMPAFRHFFDEDPRGTAINTTGIPNYRFEAIYQYLMTKGTRITPPTQAWWLGQDPINTKKIIDGLEVLPP